MPETVKIARVGNNYLVDLGKTEMLLCAEDFTRLVRACANYIGQDLPLIAPYVVKVELNYSDFGGDQESPSYGWSVKVADLDLANRVRAALDAELAATTLFASIRSEFPAVPEATLYVDRMVPLARIETALASLRGVLLAHQSDPITDDDEYWKNIGFTPTEVLNAIGCVEDIDWEYDDCVLEKLADWERENPFEPEEDRAWFDKLKRWAEGENLRQSAVDLAG